MHNTSLSIGQSEAPQHRQQEPLGGNNEKVVASKKIIALPIVELHPVSCHWGVCKKLVTLNHENIPLNVISVDI
jgi:hypothetical protein